MEPAVVCAREPGLGRRRLPRLLRGSDCGGDRGATGEPRASKGTLNPVNYFSYFTIDSNLIATGVLIAGAMNRGRRATSRLDLVRGAAVVYMSITGIVFTLLLSNTDVDTAAGSGGRRVEAV